jgi:hypothetical protein
MILRANSALLILFGKGINMESSVMWSSGGTFEPALIKDERGRIYMCSGSEQIEFTEEQLDSLSLFLRSMSKLGVRFIGETGNLALTEGGGGGDSYAWCNGKVL